MPETTTVKPGRPDRPSSSLSSIRNKFRPRITFKEDVSKFLPPGYKLPQATEPPTTTTTTTTESSSLEAGRGVKETNRISSSFRNRFKSNFRKSFPIKKDDVTNILPPDFKPSQRTTTNEESDALLRELLDNLKDKDLKKLLPDEFVDNLTSTTVRPPPRTTTRRTTATTTLRTTTASGRLAQNTVRFEDVSKFLPPGYKLTTTPEPNKLDINNLFKNIKVTTVNVPSSLLPKGYNPAEAPAELLPKDYKPQEAPASLLPKG